jgi:hypothetical protein
MFGTEERRMAMPFSMKRIVLAAILGTAATLAGMPSCARAMVGDVPSMPTLEQTTTVTSGGSTDTSGGTSPGSGSPPPTSTPEPSAFLSGLLGIGLLAAYLTIYRAHN